MDLALRLDGMKRKICMEFWAPAHSFGTSSQKKFYGEVHLQHVELWFCQRGWCRETEINTSGGFQASWRLLERLCRRARPSKCRKLPLNPGMGEWVRDSGGVGTNNMCARAQRPLSDGRAGSYFKVQNLFAKLKPPLMSPRWRWAAAKCTQRCELRPHIH